MKLPRPFFRLPLRFEVERLQAEVRALDESAWQRHPTGYRGNSAVRLISVGGGENDRVTGAMSPTPHLAMCPYIAQLLGEFGVVWGRSRLMRLGPKSVVPEHADISYQWFHRVRMHIPVQTYPEVRFHCGGQSVHMAAGECWLFDNWRLHRVDNPTDHERIHLVADTTGTAPFWQMVERSQSEGFDRPAAGTRDVPYVPGRVVPLMTERFNASSVMPPAEVDFLLADLWAELALERDTPEAQADLQRIRSLLSAFRQEWRALWSLHGDDREAWPNYRRLCETMGASVEALATPVRMRGNGMLAKDVLKARVLIHAVNPPDAASVEDEYAAKPPRRTQVRGTALPPRREQFDRPIMIVAAPRSGSTLLFETLACSQTLVTVGDEIHGIVEGLEALRPGAPGVDSNRLTQAQATAPAAEAILTGIRNRLRDSAGRSTEPGTVVRFLEKTPKNALRIPFFDALFQDARFVFLWREPRENISSIMEAWRDTRWITYPTLEGWEGPWSMLLPPGWRDLRGKALEEIAAYQWRKTNDVILEDLHRLDPARWLILNYADFIKDPTRQVQRICTFADIPFDDGLRQRCAAPLPPSRYTQTTPDPAKWRKNEEALERVLPSVFETLVQLRRLSSY